MNQRHVMRLHKLTCGRPENLYGIVRNVKEHLPTLHGERLDHSNVVKQPRIVVVWHIVKQGKAQVFHTERHDPNEVNHAKRVTMNVTAQGLVRGAYEQRPPIRRAPRPTLDTLLTDHYGRSPLGPNGKGFQNVLQSLDRNDYIV